MKPAICIALVLSLALAPAFSAGGAPPAEIAISAIGPVVRVTADAVHAPATPVARFHEAIAAQDALAARAALHAVAAERGLRAPVVFSSSGAADAWEGAMSAVTQGDATGDGRSEALLAHQTGGRGGTTVVLRMASPPGSTELWQRSVTAPYVEVTPAIDLDGDRLTDLLVLSLVVKETPRSDASPPKDDPNHTWRLTAVRGSDGATLWERVEAGRFVEHRAPLLGGTTTATVLTSQMFVPFVGGDADGDGGADVWLNVFDLATERSEGGLVEAPAARAWLDRFELLSGKTGATVSILPVPTTPGGANVVFPAEDMTGDKRADGVLTSISLHPTEENRYVTLVAGLDGATGAPRWATSVADGLAIGVPVPDLTGDALADVVVDVAYGKERRIGVNGADGASLWTFLPDFFLWVVPGDADGDGGADVLFVDADHDAATRQSYARVSAVNGRTGAVLYDERPVHVTLPTNGYTGVGLGVLQGDFDGDGVVDTVFNTDSGVWPEQFTGSWTLVSAATGLVIAERLGADLAVRSVGDLTGDGRTDLLQVRIAYEPFSLEATAIDAATFGDLWTRTFGGPQLLGVGFDVGEDFGGSGADDLLVTLVEGEGKKDGPSEGTTRLEAVGADGRIVWSA